MSNLILLEDLKKIAPSKLKPLIQQELVDELNQLSNSSDALMIRDNLISYAEVLNEGRYKLDDYFNAIKYVSYKMMGLSQVDAYAKTFPDRYARLVSENKSAKDIGAYACIYNKNKLVVEICKRTLIPPKILYQDVYHASIKQLVSLMQNGANDRVKVMAATELMKELSPKEDGVTQINIGIQQDNSIEELKRSFGELAKQQRQMIEQGMTAKTIAERSIIDVEPEPKEG